MAGKGAKKRTWHDVHIIGNGIDVYRTVWEDRETGAWTVRFDGAVYEVGRNGSSDQLKAKGYYTCLG